MWNKFIYFLRNQPINHVTEVIYSFGLMMVRKNRKCKGYEILILHEGLVNEFHTDSIIRVRKEFESLIGKSYNNFRNILLND